MGLATWSIVCALALVCGARLVRARCASGASCAANAAAEALTKLEHETFRLELNKFKILSKLGPVGPSADPGLVRELRANASLALAQQPTPRQRRSLSCSQVKSNKNACCVEPFYVNFTDIGWDKWIIHPAGYHANYCRGACDLSFARYYHSTLLSKLSSAPALCCSPRRMSSLPLLYVDADNKVVQKSMPDMVVESCDCA